MKKSDLKQLIKPLVKECIHEVLLEEGLLSNVVSEVAKGMRAQERTNTFENHSKAPRTIEPQVKKKASEVNKKLQEHRQKLMEGMGNDAYNGVNLFEGTTPMTPQESSATTGGNVDLGSESDAGVDISALVGGAAKVWQAMK